ncbi:hypothetical protein D9758_015356 [Tetrapyrgos nigripes]|uniref:Uncharacterized protein n=1 Tax=Tetrapyrgos nigripes TaxID=182062 RepID=A0A8H5FNY3_9AGAR|nr:hypothetical protein D9758_015356 [Tetrapyrgos nigripes]
MPCVEVHNVITEPCVGSGQEIGGHFQLTDVGTNDGSIQSEEVPVVEFWTVSTTPDRTLSHTAESITAASAQQDNREKMVPLVEETGFDDWARYASGQAAQSGEHFSMREVGKDEIRSSLDNEVASPEMMSVQDSDSDVDVAVASTLNPGLLVNHSAEMENVVMAWEVMDGATEDVVGVDQHDQGVMVRDVNIREPVVKVASLDGFTSRGDSLGESPGVEISDVYATSPLRTGVKEGPADDVAMDSSPEARDEYWTERLALWNGGVSMRSDVEDSESDADCPEEDSADGEVSDDQIDFDDDAMVIVADLDERPTVVPPIFDHSIDAEIFPNFTTDDSPLVDLPLEPLVHVEDIRPGGMHNNGDTLRQRSKASGSGSRITSSLPQPIVVQSPPPIQEYDHFWDSEQEEPTENLSTRLRRERSRRSRSGSKGSAKARNVPTRERNGITDTARDDTQLRSEDVNALKTEIKRLLEDVLEDATSLYNHFCNLLESNMYTSKDILALVHACIVHCQATKLQPKRGLQREESRSKSQSTTSTEVDDKEKQYRPYDKVKTARAVREVARLLLQPEGEALRSATRNEVLAFNNCKHSGPTEQYFILDFWSKGIWNTWNQQATDLFVNLMKRIPEYEKYYEEHIHDAFRTHLRQLQRRFMQPSHVPKSQAVSEKEQELRRDQRQRRLLERRLNAIDRFSNKFPDAMKHIQGLKRYLKKDVMSDDETSDEGPGKVNIKKMDWRAQQLEDMLRRLCALHLSFKYCHNGKYKPGAFPEARYPSGLQDRTREQAPARLPINFYDEVWLNDPAYPNRKASLRPKPAVDLSLTEQC